jgi:uncharacterized protein YggE
MNRLHTALMLVTSIVLPTLTPLADEERPLVPSVTVVGMGETTSRPDMAQVQVGVVTQSKTAAQALEENNTAMTALFKSLSDHGVGEKDIQTTNFNVAPQYRRDDRGQQATEIVGYQVTNMLRVKVRQLNRLGKVIDDVVKLGANQLHGISFSVAEPAPLFDEARRKAMADARRKAELYAQEAGVKLGRVRHIQEQPPHVPRGEFLGLARAAAAESVPVAPGEQEFHASITVTYAIE